MTMKKIVIQMLLLLGYVLITLTASNAQSTTSLASTTALSSEFVESSSPPVSSTVTTMTTSTSTSPTTTSPATTSTSPATTSTSPTTTSTSPTTTSMSTATPSTSTSSTTSKPNSTETQPSTATPGSTAVQTTQSTPSLSSTPGSTHEPTATVTTVDKTSEQTVTATTTNTTHIGGGLTSSEITLTVVFGIGLGLVVLGLIVYNLKKCRRRRLPFYHQRLYNSSDDTVDMFAPPDDTLVISGGLYDGTQMSPGDVHTFPVQPAHMRLEFLNDAMERTPGNQASTFQTQQVRS